jgi:hypothetical protein
MTFELNPDDINIPVLLYEGWTLQSDGSWNSPDGKSTFLRTKEGARMLLTWAPGTNNHRRFIDEKMCLTCNVPVHEDGNARLINKDGSFHICLEKA